MHFTFAFLGYICFDISTLYQARCIGTCMPTARDIFDVDLVNVYLVCWVLLGISTTHLLAWVVQARAAVLGTGQHCPLVVRQGRKSCTALFIADFNCGSSLAQQVLPCAVGFLISLGLLEDHPDMQIRQGKSSKPCLHT